MRHRFALVVILLVSTLFASAALPSESRYAPGPTDPEGVVVHEWGTFTSVAGLDGHAVEWLPLDGPTDLPCFVDKVSFTGKGWIPGTVRMETPVLYFYSPRDAVVDVKVRFPRGLMTEWYPSAEVNPQTVSLGMLARPGFEGSIAWKDVRVLPHAPETYPPASGDSHYFVARQTDASPVQVGSEREKFLFYRGVAAFEPRLRATLTPNGGVLVASADGRPVGDVTFFENWKGRTTHTSRRASGATVTLSRSTSPSSAAAVRAQLVDRLVASGLYRREAVAMVDTWRDSWFEEGARVFYILSQKDVDSLLTLEITPQPAAIARVFVGRIELVTDAMVQEVRSAVARRDGRTLYKYGRFLRPIVQRIVASDSASTRLLSSEALTLAWEARTGKTTSCQ
jgi:hypothetical protein